MIAEKIRDHRMPERVRVYLLVQHDIAFDAHDYGRIAAVDAAYELMWERRFSAKEVK